MGGRGASSGAGRATNTKYNGFKVVSKDGKEMNLVIEHGVVGYADGHDNNNGFLGNDLEVFQKVYDKEGSAQAIIDRINKIGIGKAGKLSDKAVNDLREKRRKDREENEKNYSPRKSKKGVNRHSLYWSAM